MAVVNRKCRTCGYFEPDFSRNRGWCYWKGAPRNAGSEECEDGYKEKDD
ncbi:hypothetical protein [Prevotella communis]|nr:hypothetical protein [Prevotella communis]